MWYSLSFSTTHETTTYEVVTILGHGTCVSVGVVGVVGYIAHRMAPGAVRFCAVAVTLARASWVVQIHR